MLNHVQFDDSYFKKTINEYQDWQFAFFRETAQNSCDAKASIIHYRIIEKDDHIYVECTDNGNGMTKDILLSKFLVMGGSHKSEGSVGGFGYAKSIILFCHPFYEIHSQDNLLTGGYGRYSDPVQSDFYKGTKITVHVDKDSSSYSTLCSKLKHWVENSTLKGTKVFLNDEELKQCNLKTMKYKNETTVGQLAFKKIVDEYSYYSTLWVRMRGMAMFPKNIYSNENHFTGYLDLDAESSMSCLTANRDGLKPDYDSALNSLIQQLSEEMTSLQMDDLEGFKINLRNKAFEEEQIPFSNDDMFSPQSRKERRSERHRHQAALILGHQSVDEFLEEDKKKKETLDQKIESVIDKIKKEQYPDNFKILISKLKGKGTRDVLKEYNKAVKVLNQSRVQNNCYTWQKMICAILDIAKETGLLYLEKQNGTFFYMRKPINFGVIISEDSEVLGCCEETSNDFTISFNPLKFKSSEYTLFDLLQVAIHEITHLQYKEHNERFAYFLFSLTKAVNDKKLNIKKL